MKLSCCKEATFWHLVSTGKIEEDRNIDLRRCERIRWPKPIIEHSTEQGHIYVWVEEINKEERIHLLCARERYLVVLAVRKGYVLPWTAFFIEYDHQLRKKLKRYEEYKSSINS